MTDAPSQEESSLGLDMLASFLLLVSSIPGQPIDWHHLPHSGYLLPLLLPHILMVSGSTFRDTLRSMLCSRQLSRQLGSATVPSVSLCASCPCVSCSADRPASKSSRLSDSCLLLLHLCCPFLTGLLEKLHLPSRLSLHLILSWGQFLILKTSSHKLSSNPRLLLGSIWGKYHNFL